MQSRGGSSTVSWFGSAPPGDVYHQERGLLPRPLPHTALPRALSDSLTSCRSPLFVVVASTTEVPFADMAAASVCAQVGVPLLPPLLSFVLSLTWPRGPSYRWCCPHNQAAMPEGQPSMLRVLCSPSISCH